MSERLVFHVDVNSAFLSWTAMDRVRRGEEDLRLIPSCVGGNPKSRTGIVVAKSIPAKEYGITTGEPMSMAIRKCPGLVVVPSDFSLYQRCSKAFKAICKEYTADMESFSIDEVFMDMTGMSRLYPDPVQTAHMIKNRIKNELGFTVNVGIGANKLCAKMASDFQKPDRVHTLFLDEIESKMWPLPVGDLFTCGKASAAKLTKIGINTIGDLAKADLSLIKRILGDKPGLHLHNYANGIDDSPVKEIREEAKGFSVETTVEDNLDTLDKIDRLLLSQADIVAARMRREEAKCRCIGVTLRTTEFVNHSHQRKLPDSTDVTDEIYREAKKLAAECWDGEPLRLIGLSLTDIDRSGFEQLTFFDDENKEKQKKLDNVLDTIRGKFGNSSIKRASTIQADDRIGGKYKAALDNEVEDRNNHNGSKKI